MHGLALIGVSHRRGGAAALEAYQERYVGEGEARLAAFGLREYVTVATCNRWDVVTVVPDGQPLDALRQRLAPDGQPLPYAFVQDGALEQLARVAASLDSLNPGEDQIMRQVRDAYTVARELGHTGPVTSYAFETALRVAKRVRREVALAPVRTSLFSLVRPELEALLRPGDTAVVLGAGEMGALAARGLAELPGVHVVIANRSVARAEEVARALTKVAKGATVNAAPLDDVLCGAAAPQGARVLVCATPVRHLVSAELLDRMPALALVVDLGLPRNVDPDAALTRALRVLDVDGLQAAGAARREAMGENLLAAEAIVRSELDEAVSAWTERQLAHAIRRLRAEYLRTIGEALPPEAAERLAKRFAHVPITGLRAVAREHGFEAAATFLRAVGIQEES